HTEVTATISTMDSAGNAGSAHSPHSYMVDTQAPEVTLTIGPIGQNGVIDGAEVPEFFRVGGAAGGDASSDDEITVTVGDEIYTTTIQGTGTWAVDIPGHILVQHTSVTASITVADAAGNVSTVTHTQPYTVQSVNNEIPKALGGELLG